MADQVAAQASARRLVVGLDRPVAALDAVAAEHDQVAPYVVAWVLVDMVQREVPGRAADGTLEPLVVQGSEKVGVPDSHEEVAGPGVEPGISGL